MIRAVNVRIYPNKRQRIQIHKTIGCSRFIYNQMLNERKQVHEQLKHDREALNACTYKTEKQYKVEFPFLKEADSIALQASREHLHEAYQNFFKHEMGFPKFKSKRGKESYTTKQTNGNIKIDFERKRIKLPKLEWLKFHDKREFSEKIKRATVKKTKSNRYFVSLTLEAQDDVRELQRIHERNVMAFDMSATNFLINDIVKMENPRMQQFNSGLSKSVSLDFSWYQFTTYLRYKMEWSGKHLVQVDRFFASSKLCSCCGWKNNNLTLSERAWTCVDCGATHDRDTNASINLRKEGIRILQKEKQITIIHDDDTPTVGTTGSHAFGDDVRPQEILQDLFGQFSRN